MVPILSWEIAKDPMTDRISGAAYADRLANGHSRVRGYRDVAVEEFDGLSGSGPRAYGPLLRKPLLRKRKWADGQNQNADGNCTVAELHWHPSPL